MLQLLYTNKMEVNNMTMFSARSGGKLPDAPLQDSLQNTMRIGFSKSDITPPAGIVLGGYAGYRPCGGVHDPLFCKAVVLEQGGVRFCLMTLDLLCVDEGLYHRIAQRVADLDIAQQRLIVSAIHTHAAPQGVVADEGPLATVNCSAEESSPQFRSYMEEVVDKAVFACRVAAEALEPFWVRAAKGATPPVGSERHTGAAPGGDLTVIQCKTSSGKLLTLYNFPCHPTVLGPSNLLASADFVANIEALLSSDMAMFLNGAAGDISTRFTRREATFAECARMGQIAAEHVRSTIQNLPFNLPQPLLGSHTTVFLQARPVESVESAQAALQSRTTQWQAALAAGADEASARLLKTYVEGAWVNLEFAKSMAGITQLALPVTLFRFAGLDFATIPGELFSTLQPEGLCVITYANGYFRYICPEEAYEANHYEAMAAIVARGGGEQLIHEIQQLRRQLSVNQ